MKLEVSEDQVFRALADPGRREMLDRVKARPGVTVGEICSHFPVSRFAVMKHLRVLEGAALLVRVREGKTKRLYLNAIPIQTIHDRWISKYSALWASQLNAMKYQLEQEESPMEAPELKHVHVLFIRTTAEKLWQALTRPEQTRNYFFHTAVESDFQPGSGLRYLLTEPDGQTSVPVQGQVLQAVPLQRLVHSFKFHGSSAGPSRVAYEIEDLGGMVKLTVTHDQFGDDRTTFDSTSNGWPVILNGLKTWLETGEPLKFPAMSV